VRLAFDALPETHRVVLQLARSGRGYGDIAEHLGVSVVVVRRWALHAVLALTRARTAAVHVPGGN
jgi:DNA-directed RNA polymerase specialized sigma24 family protein